MNLQEIKDRFNQKTGQANQISFDLNEAKKSRESIQKEINYSIKSQTIIQTIARKTQQELEYRICEPVSLALEAVYNNPYKMVADFQITGRGTTECTLAFERNGNIIKPLMAAGGGVVDIASFALKIGALSLAIPRSRPVLLIDEPLKWVDKQKISGSETTTMHLAGQMLKQVTQPPPTGLGLQIIMISHISELIESADQIIEVYMKDGISMIRTK